MKIRRAFILIVIIILTACSKDIKTEIIGLWEGVSLKQNIRFYEDGRVELKDLKHGLYRGRYKLTEGNTLNCEFDRFAHPVVRIVKIRSDKLILTAKSGREEIYRKKL